MRSSMWLSVLVLFVLGIGSEAHAGGGKMDWSEYIEPPGARTPVQETPTQRPAKAEKASKKVAKAAAKKKAKAKKSKRSARNKRRR